MNTYFDDLANTYDEMYLDNISQAENSIIQELLERAIWDNWIQQSVLDIGCGTWLIPELIWKYIGEYIGIDISGNMIEIARSKFTESKYSFSAADWNTIWFSTFHDIDLIVSTFWSASYIDNLSIFLSEAYTRLSTNGVIFLMVYSRFSRNNILSADSWIESMSLVQTRSCHFRKDSEFIQNSIWSDANLYDMRSLDAIISKTLFSKKQILWLNVFCDLWKAWMKSKVDWEMELKKEMDILPADLGHSLIIILKK